MAKKKRESFFKPSVDIDAVKEQVISEDMVSLVDDVYSEEEKKQQKPEQGQLPLTPEIPEVPAEAPGLSDKKKALIAKQLDFIEIARKAVDSVPKSQREMDKQLQGRIVVSRKRRSYKNKKRISLYMEDTLYAKIKMLAVGKNMTMNDLICIIMERSLGRMKQQKTIAETSQKANKAFQKELNIINPDDIEPMD